MINFKSVSKVATVIFMVCCFISKAAAALPDHPMSKEMAPLKAAVAIDRLILPALDMQSLRDRAANKAANNTLKGTNPRPLEFASPYDIARDINGAGTWQSLQHDSQQIMVWRFVVESPNAYSLNFGFSNYYMPQGGQMFIYGDDYEHLLGPFTSEHNEEHGELWTPIFNTNKVTIEINVPAARKQELQLTISRVNQGYLDFQNIEKDIQALKSGSCNVDVACPISAGWENQIRSVARYTISGQFLCTGSAINNTAGNRRPLFLTANHCGVNSTNDSSVVAYWNYQNSSCRAPGSSASGSFGNGSLSQFNLGAIVIAQYATADMELLEFEEPILPAANVYFAGWDRRNIAPSSVVAIHHPQGEEKRISFENDPLSISTYLGSPGSGSTHLRVADWDVGTTEGGSSGSAIFNSNKQIVGQLHGGFAACGNNSADWYGRIAVSWLGGGTASQQLRAHLDPNNTGQQTLNGINVNAPPNPPPSPNPNTRSIVPVPAIYLLLE